jgi:hypothetical protein
VLRNISRRRETWTDAGGHHFKTLLLKRQVKLQGQVEVGFICENIPVTAAKLLKNIKNTP